MMCDQWKNESRALLNKYVLSFDLNSLKELTVLSARGSEFQSLGAVTEKDLLPIEDRRNLGTQRSSELGNTLFQ